MFHSGGFMELLNLTREKLTEILVENQFKKFTSQQVFQWIYQKYIYTFNDMTNISKNNRKNLSALFTIQTLPEPHIWSSDDGTEKLQFDLVDGNCIESVIIPEKDRNTLCISTQVGCPLQCRFCRTGHLGFLRNLSVAEIVGQVLYAQHYLSNKGRRITNIVYMGMGEPLLNFENTLDSLSILMDELGLNFSNRRITISTIGITDKIIPLGKATSVNLALSLHSPDEKIRAEIMPATKNYPLEKLIKTVKHYPMHQRKKLLIEYVMLDGVNDRPEDAKNLIKITKELNAKVNLIPFNSFDGATYNPTPMDKILIFQETLSDNNITALIRKSRGDDHLAACGQLGSVRK